MQKPDTNLLHAEAGKRIVSPGRTNRSGTLKLICAGEGNAGRGRVSSDLLRSPDGSALFAHGE